MTTPRIVAIAAAAVALIAGAAVAVVLLRPDSTPAAAADSASPAPSVSPTNTPASSTTPPAFTVSGSVTLFSSIAETSADCAGKGPNAAFKRGADVSILGADGVPVAKSVLGIGAIDGLTCVFLFVVKEVPPGQGTYSVTVAGRPVKTVSEKELANTDLVIRVS